MYSKKYKYLVKYNAKSACTLIRKLFLELHKNELTKSPKRDYHDIHFDFPYTNNSIIKKKIHIVRNPYKRVVSMFTEKYIGKKNTLHNVIKLNKHTFYEFVKSLYNTNPDNIKDSHVKKQSRIYESNDIIIKCENLNDNLLKFYKEFNDELYVKVNTFFTENINVNKTPRNDTKIYVYDTVYEPGIDRSWPDYKYFYNDEIKNMVYEIYKEDFINFNYDKDSI